MLPALLASKSISWLSSERLLTILKVGAIISLMGATSVITWNLAQRDIDKERLSIALKQVEAEKASTAYWMEQINTARQISIKAAEADKKLEIKVNAILKDHNNAPPLPTNCVIDASGLLSLSAARNAAIETANSSATNKSDN